jgi:pyruvate dehydrogenase E2 component (dihydrolipoamide acetyltransferase)
MPYEFKLPDIGEGVVEGEVVRWLVNEGDAIRQDQPMVEVMTDKATVEIPAPRAGRVLRRMFAEGDICPVGRVLITIEEAGDAAATSAARAEPASTGREAATVVTSPLTGRVESASSRGNGHTRAPKLGSVLATPATRKLAREVGVDLGMVTATGPHGRITPDDVRRTAGVAGDRRRADVPLSRPGRRPDDRFEEDVRVPFRGLRRKIAEHMTRAKREAAHFTYVEEVDATALVDLRSKANARLASQNVKLSFLPFIVKAAADALGAFPRLNATLDEAAGEIVQRRRYHIGVATATDDGLVVPVVRDADRLSLVALGREIERLAAATRAGRATRDELTGSTFTITSLGTLGGVLATPIINHPEVAILGVHKIAKRAVVVEGKQDTIEIREMMNLSISVDHRLVDGHEAARFVAQVKESLETPGLLFLESV